MSVSVTTSISWRETGLILEIKRGYRKVLWHKKQRLYEQNWVISKKDKTFGTFLKIIHHKDKSSKWRIIKTR